MVSRLIFLLVVTLGEISNNMVEAKYCPIEIDGDVKYYICPRNEICCTFGCCISSNFHFYQLWYYWLMVILMFLLCSGGTWWYRYWLQEGHYPPVPPPTHRPPPPRHRPPCTRATYHPARTTRVVVQHTWKQNRNGVVGYPTPPPSYSYVQHQALTDAVDESAASEVVNLSVLVPEPKTSPYYKLYGPPPSYDSVMTQTLTEQSQNSNRLGVEEAHNNVDGYSENQHNSQNTHSQSDEDCQEENTDEMQNNHNVCVEMQEDRFRQGIHRSSSASQSTSRSTSTCSTSRSHKHNESKGLSK